MVLLPFSPPYKYSFASSSLTFSATYFIAWLLPIIVDEKVEWDLFVYGMEDLFGDGIKYLFVNGMKYLFRDGMEYYVANTMEYYIVYNYIYFLIATNIPPFGGYDTDLLCW